MPRLSLRLHRPSAGLMLLLHLAVLAAWAPHASATRNGTPLAHFENAGGSDCQVPHDDDACGLCQLSSTRVVATDLAVPQPPEARVTLARRADQRVRSSQITPGCGNPRAPPTQAA